MSPIPSTQERTPRILIVRVGAMGDVLHGMPAVAALRAAMPKAHIGWAIEPRWSPLLREHKMTLNRGIGMPLVDAVHEVPTKEWSKRPFSFRTLRSILALRHELRQAQYDIVIDLQGSIRSSLIATMTNATQRVGAAAPRERQARWFYSRKVVTRRPNVVDQAAEIVSAAVGHPLQPVAAPLPLSLVAEEWCDALFRDITGHPVVLLAPTAGWPAKEWPAVRFGHLAAQLHTRGCTVLVNAAPGDADSIASLVVACSQGRARAVPCTMPQLIALVQRTDLVIAGDTGPLHLAAAAGVPALGLFGPTDPTRTGPWGKGSRTLRHRLSKTNHRRLKRVEEGLAEITVSEVLQTALELLRGRPLCVDNDKGMTAPAVKTEMGIGERLVRRIRVPLGFVFAAFFLWRARPSLLSLAFSLLLVAPGLWLRGYAAGYVKKNAELTQTGPYAYTRNPLYLGSALAAFGFAFASRRWELVVLLLLLFLVIYGPVILSEERFLRAHFPDFDSYAARVPRLLPRVTAAPAPAGQVAAGFDTERYRKHREYNSVMGAAGIYATLLLLMWARAHWGMQ